MSTVKNILRKYFLLGHIAARKSYLNERYVRSRLNWCEAYSNVYTSLLNNVIFIDECLWNYLEEGGNMSGNQREPDSMTNIPPYQ